MKLSQKLLEIQKACVYFQKDTKGYNFTYTSGSAILGVVRSKMDELGVLCYPEIKEAKTTLIDKGGKTQILTELSMDFVWRCTETDAQLRIPWYGQGLKDTEQGIGNALTYAERYFLLKFFKIATDSDDPDLWAKNHKPKTTAEIEAEVEEEKKKVFEKKKKAIFDYIAKEPTFKGFLIGEGADPSLDENIEAIYDNSRALKEKFLKEEGR